MRKKLTSRLSEPGLSFGRLRALPLGSKIALVVVLIVVALSVFASVIAQFDPLATGTPATGPDGSHWFGTDSIGRDIFSRVAHGAQNSLLIGLCATLLALLVACILGSIAATANKWISEILMRFLDVVMSFPGIALAAVFVAVWGSSLPVLIVAIAFIYTPQLTRIVRANVLEQFGEDYIAASRVAGASTPHIIVKHVARNCIAPVLVFATVLVADAIVFEASLSFINAGVRPPEPSWGNILADGKDLLLDGGWWATFFPGLMILITVLALNVLSEGVTDAMVSPAQRKPVKIDDKLEARETDSAGARVGAATSTPLAERLDELRGVEETRTDRLHFESDARPLLEVDDLSIRFPAQHGDVNVVDGVSLMVRPGETLGLVGESGSGKSITTKAIMGLLPKSSELDGTVRFGDVDNMLELSNSGLNKIRGHEIALIPQDALSALNPSMLIRTQIKQLTARGGKRTAEELLTMVGLEPERTLKSYPHELSGGQRQRVLIAMALTRNPKLVIADEPTTALDVTVQKQVIDLINSLRDELGFAMIFVSHDLALVAQVAHRITVMYAGQVVETGTTREILTDPRHEYTKGLLGSVLSIESGTGRLHQVPGVVPSPSEFAAGDRFAPRSANPSTGEGAKPTLQFVPGTTHAFATHEKVEATS